jgi:catechol 2,3-dioxygenase-like lactoylglutathione lyase family enzyme
MKMGSYLQNMFQFGYVTRDLDRAKQRMSEVLGIREYYDVEADFPIKLYGETARYHMRGALANLGDKQIELIEPIDGVVDFYCQGLRLDDAVVQLHHVGILIEQPSGSFDDMPRIAAEAGYPIVLEGGDPSYFSFIYADARADFGHYLEFLAMTPEALAWHRSFPDQAA